MTCLDHSELRTPVPARRTPARRTLVAVKPVLVAVALLGAGCADADARDAQSQEPDPKVTVAGDSISVGLGSSLRDAVDSSVTVKVIGQSGTGLARPDVFDWPERLGELAADFPPDVLVFSVGSNDSQDLRDASGAVVAAQADGWRDEYSRRLARAFDAFEATDTEVVWVGHVRTEEPDVAETNREVHELATELAASRDWVRVEDLAELTGSGDDETSGCLIADGLHLSVDCYDTAAVALVPRLGMG